MKREQQCHIDNQRWRKYLTAGIAGSLVSLCPNSSVDADFTYVSVNVDLVDRTQGDGYFDNFGPYTFGASGASFIFQQAFNEIGTDVGILAILAGGNLSIAGLQYGNYFYVSNLSAGPRCNSNAGAILSQQGFNIQAGNRGSMAWGDPGFSNSQFLEPGHGYVGFRFDVGNGTQYGWAEVEMDGAPFNTARFVGYGYAGPGESLRIGDHYLCPEPGAMSVLALGAIGVGMWRGRRKRAVVKSRDERLAV